jgi:hypothetical protein
MELGAIVGAKLQWTKTRRAMRSRLIQRRRRPSYEPSCRDDFYGLMPSRDGQILSSKPVRSQGRLVAAANLGIFVFVRNHPPALFDSPENIVIGLLMRDFES